MCTTRAKPLIRPISIAMLDEPRTRRGGHPNVRRRTSATKRNLMVAGQ
jgi:hypothetical protein